MTFQNRSKRSATYCLLDVRVLPITVADLLLMKKLLVVNAMKPGCLLERVDNFDPTAAPLTQRVDARIRQRPERE